MFIGLNPSTADETKDDPTIRRCIQFAKDWGWGGLVMVNLFAFRTPHSKGKKPMNTERIAELKRRCEEYSNDPKAWIMVRASDLRELLAKHDAAMRYRKALDDLKVASRICNPEYRVQRTDKIIAAALSPKEPSA